MFLKSDYNVAPEVYIVPVGISYDHNAALLKRSIFLYFTRKQILLSGFADQIIFWLYNCLFSLSRCGVDV